MKRSARLRIAGLLVCLALGITSGAALAATYRVNIPYALFGRGRAAEFKFVAPRSATYHISLTVENLNSDPGVGDFVPIGMRAVARRNRNRRLHYNDTGWQTGLGQGVVEVYARKGDGILITFSTSAPLGARGILEIDAR